MHVSILQIGEQHGGKDDSPDNQDAAHGRRVSLGSHQRVEIRMLELGGVADLSTNQPPDARLAEYKHEREGGNRRGEYAKLDLVQHLQNRVSGPFAEPLITVLKQVVEHPSETSSAIRWPRLLIP